MGWGGHWCWTSSPASLSHLPEHDKLCLIHRASAPSLISSSCCSIFEDPGTWCCFALVRHAPLAAFLPSCMLPSVKLSLQRLWELHIPSSLKLSITEALQALLPLRFHHIWCAAKSLFSPSMVLSLPQLGYSLTLVRYLCGLKLLLCPSCQQFTSHCMFMLAWWSSNMLGF